MDQKKIIDITRPIHPGMAIYPGNPEVEFTQLQQAAFATSALTKIVMGSHTGSHIDALSHIDSQGASVDAYSLDIFIGLCTVYDLTLCQGVIGSDAVRGVSAKRVLLYTKNSHIPIDSFDERFVALNEEAAKALIAQGVQLVGVDGPSIKKRGVRDRVHSLLLEAGVVIVEGLWLRDVAAGDYELLCLPLALVGVDGAPVRAVLRR